MKVETLAATPAPGMVSRRKRTRRGADRRDKVTRAGGRVDGARARALATMLVERGTSSSRWALSHTLWERLKSRGIVMHERTLRRQLNGQISSVPPVVETELVTIAAREFGMCQVRETTRGSNESTDQDMYVPTDRIRPLVKLWMFLNPEGSQRALGRLLSADLEALGMTSSPNYLEALLGGRRPAAPLIVLEALLARLARQGIHDEQEALRRYHESTQPISHSLSGRQAVAPQRFWLICTAWQLHHKQPETGLLARLLQERLEAGGTTASVEQVQRAICGNTKSVRQSYEREAEAILRTDLGLDVSADLEAVLAQAHSDATAIGDLLRVEAEPLQDLVNLWQEQNSGGTLRDLARSVQRTVKSMGFQRSVATIFGILTGQAGQTRGFVYRALLMELRGGHRAEVPEEAFAEPPVRRSFLLAGREPGRLEETEESFREPLRDSVGQRFLKQAREYLPGALMDDFAEFMAFRAERLFGIDRKQALREILGT